MFSGDSGDSVFRTKLNQLFTDLEDFRSAKKPFTLEIEDLLENSFI